MKLFLARRNGTQGFTAGRLYINKEFQCFTLEDEVRDVKIKGETAIPAGEYKVVITPSNRFKRDLPLLLNVPNFEGVRIHAGNTAADTEGCILVGQESAEKGFLAKSKAAFEPLFAKIKTAIDAGEEVMLTIN
jgi:hypothetical protein